MEAENTSGMRKNFPQHNTTQQTQNKTTEHNKTQHIKHIKHNIFHVSESQTESTLWNKSKEYKKYEQV
jgi:hypothetical protein